MGAWTVLVLSGVLEAVWASALAASDGLRRPVPAVVFAVTAAVSLAGLSYAMTALPTGTAYAVWVGIGAALTVAWSMLTGRESATPLRILLVLGLVGCVIGLKVVG
ncbi:MULTISPECIES: DMT family transporter [Kocuria]|uniref:Ligand-binding protein SH3 n=1 Tax=Kocuria rosea subsp. polaris TaxID=136273 RepID=A0A0A6VVY6_KOCRO|nr:MULTISPECIES: SMR family transporter [Kocuria]MCC5781953.1 ligand-binding protein SH3 [Kocuria sp. CCUG 69068]EYT55546.1 ligand-binding protein SH3 [Kocuria sp. UCD-OTCP]KHD98318.1 ligand-binding protein SH3 [Kocuria polaris]MCM3486712.1 SMR family transporter [Kocuria rosea]MEB2525954.1 SMR family transporter [Kocuria rosea]